MFPSQDSEDLGRITNTVDESMKAAVIQTVAVRANRKPEDLPPLTEAIDPDALEAIFEPRPDGSPRHGGKLVFSYAGYHVFVSADRTVEVQPILMEEVGG